jgi:DNA-binding GntR family transcriptional regulator
MSIVVRTISEQAYQLMRERILTGSLAAGAPVRQDAVAEELGVSKIPLREALSRLEQDGLLSSSPNRGYVVRALTSAEAEEVFQLRLKLEPDATSQACLQADATAQAAAREAFEVMDRELAQGGADYVLMNRHFHAALVRPGVGLVTRQLVERLHILAERYVRVHLEAAGRDARASAEHRALLETWLARDAAGIATLTREHIAGTLRDLREQLAAG